MCCLPSFEENLNVARCWSTSTPSFEYSVLSWICICRCIGQFFFAFATQSVQNWGHWQASHCLSFSEKALSQELQTLEPWRRSRVDAAKHWQNTHMSVRCKLTQQRAPLRCSAPVVNKSGGPLLKVLNHKSPPTGALHVMVSYQTCIRNIFSFSTLRF